MTFLAPALQNPAALPWLVEVPKEKSIDWVNALRATGAEAFAQTGFPTPKWEGWQYINLRNLTPEKFHFDTSVSPSKVPSLMLQGAARIVVLNGKYMPEMSDLPKDVEVMSLTDSAQKMDGIDEHLVSVGDLADAPFKALNTAYLRDGFVLKVSKGREIARPVEVLFYNDTGAIYPRALYWLGENASCTIFERYEGAGAYFFNGYAEVVQGAASRLKLYRLMDESRSAFHYSMVSVQQQKDSSFEGFSMATGSAIGRQEFNFKLIDSGIYSSIGGAYLMKNQQNHDFTVLYDHFEPNGKSVQNFKGVIDDQARAVFQGKIHVRRSAQKADGYQSHHALLLSGQAEASAKPELEIYADDVKCSHGATSGHLDPVALFYLQSRGILEQEARALLIQSFINEVIEKVSDEAVRDIYLQKSAAWLEARGK